jgi:hypothetical protein
MKKYSRKSKRTMKRSMRSKKMTRRRRQRGGGEVLINCTLVPSTGAITATSTDTAFTVAPSANTLQITSTTPIKNIRFANATAATVGSGTGIILQNLADNKFVIPSTSALHQQYTRKPRLLPAAQTLLDLTTGKAFPTGLKVTNLNATNLGISTSKAASGAAGLPFVITITT